MKRVVVIGGGTGNFVVLSALKECALDLCAIVSMADDGGSTGILRDELGVLPPGDVRQCLVALSRSSEVMRKLMNYRFENGGLGGHSFGNLFLSALEKVTGSFESAIEELAHILSIEGRVVPVTDQKIHLRMELLDGTVLSGEREIYLSEKIDQGYRALSLYPQVRATARALEEIERADYIVMGPGGLHTSLIPNLLVDGICDALRTSKAKKILIVNLMNRKGQTTRFKASDYLKEAARYLGNDLFSKVVVNTGLPPPHLMESYGSQGSLVENDIAHDARTLSLDLIAPDLSARESGDRYRRNLIRHDLEKLRKALLTLVDPA